MTKTILITHINEIEVIKVGCKNCNFAVQFPIKNGYQKVVKCINCDIPFPANLVQGLINSINDLRVGLSGDFSGVDVVFETTQ